MKHLSTKFYCGLAQILFLVLVLGSLSACREDPLPQGANFHYTVHVKNENYTDYLVLDSVQGSVIQVGSTPNWLSVSQDGEEEGHPKMRFDVQPFLDYHRQSADVEIVLSSKQIVLVTVIQQSLMGANDLTDPNFNKENWRTADSIMLYDPKTHSMKYVSLPWSSASSTAMPDCYVYPNKNEDWELIMNTCNIALLDGVHIFALYKETASQLRFYTYLDEAPGAGSSYYITFSTGNSSGLYDPTAVPWMVPNNVTFNTRAIPSSLPELTPGTVVVAPGTADASGVLSKGWICYELNFPGIHQLKSQDNLTIQMISVTTVNTTGTLNITGTLQGDSCELITPGNKTLSAAMKWETSGSLFSEISTTIAETGEAIKDDKSEGAVPVLTAVLGGAGAICSAVGGYMEAFEAGEDSKQLLNLKFNVTETGQVTMISTSAGSTTFPPLKTTFGYLFGSSDDTYQFGTWTVEEPPVIYISSDVLFYDGDAGNTYYMNSDKASFYQAGSKDEGLRFVSFLDPNSIKLMLNNNPASFPYNDVDSVVVQAYDFAFVDDANTYPVCPYYEVFGINLPEIQVSNAKPGLTPLFSGNTNDMQLIQCTPAQILSVPDTSIRVLNRTTSEEANPYHWTYRYGSNGGVLFESSLSPYNIIEHPLVYVPRSNDGYYSNHAYLGHLGVAVVAYIFLHGKDEPLVYANRMLPQFRTFTKNDVASLKTALNNGSSDQTTTDGKPVHYHFYNDQRDRALRMLNEIN